MFTTLKMAVFAPMPRVRMARAERVNPGFLWRTRIGYVKVAQGLFHAGCTGTVWASAKAMNAKLLRKLWTRHGVRPWDDCDLFHFGSPMLHNGSPITTFCQLRPGIDR